jgi:hypothetical protein
MDTQSIPGNAIDCVNAREAVPLTFTAVDGLAFAAQKGKLGGPSSKSFMVGDVGPLLELRHLFTDGRLPPLESILASMSSHTVDLFAALKQSQQRLWTCPATKRIGFIRTTNSEDDASNSYNFGTAAQRAAAEAGFSKLVASQLVAAILEMVDNIYLHSTLPESGLAAFDARPGYFEFAVLDRGIGILRSLQQSAEYARLSDHGDALQMALTDGCSRFGPNTNHGHGFRPLFIGLSNLNGALRFRTGDHALTIDGRDPISIPWTKMAKPNISGFLAFVSCQTHARKRSR